MIRLALVAAVLFAPVSADAGACAQPQPKYDVATAADASISSGGGLIAEIDDASKVPAWRFEGADANVAPHAIAPGLMTIDLPAGKDWLVLDGADHKPLVRAKHADKDDAALAAPAVTGVTYSSSTGRRGTYVNVTVKVRAVPKNAFALVLYGVDASGKTARSYGRVQDPSATDIGVYFSGSCIAMAVGTVATNAGDKVALAWLDASGRLSKPSATITVK